MTSRHRERSSPGAATAALTKAGRARRRAVLLAASGAALAAALAGAFLFQERQETTAPASGPALYVGSRTCSACHAEETETWRGSDHERAMAVADERSVLGDFGGASFRHAGVTSTFFRRGGKYFVRTDGPDGKLADFAIEHTFGVYPLQQYLIALPGGRLQALGIAWDARPKPEGGQRWFHLYPDREVRAGDPLHWTGIDQNWNFQCAECHSTNLRKGFDAASRTFATTWAEINVACEACHGPGSRHVAWAKAKGRGPERAGDLGLTAALDERRGVTWRPLPTGNAVRSEPRLQAREIETCARCHGRAGRISDDYVHGRSPLDTHRLALLEDGLYWPDGQIRGEVYEWGSFAQSKMSLHGVTCSDCHDPHTTRLRAPGNAVCAQCHHPAKFDAPSHTHHAAGSPGAACVDCHMPATTYMEIDPRRDHSMRVPRPDLSVSLGVPNACDRCHAGEGAAWAAAAIRSWTGRDPASFQQFAGAFAAAAAGAPAARHALTTLAGDAGQPAIVRASAIARLGRLAEAGAPGVAITGLNDPDALVRQAAVEALAAADPPTRLRVLPGLLRDPVRGVRIEAARLLAGTEGGLPADVRPAFDQALAEYVAVQIYNADRPEGLANLGNLAAGRGDLQGAITHYRQAIAVDPAFVPAYVNLADALNRQGAHPEAGAALRQGLQRAPNAAVLHHALGLTLARENRLPEALVALASAVRLEAGNPRYAYVLAVALHENGQPKQAIRTLSAALEQNPASPSLLEAMVSFQERAGRHDLALLYLQRLRALVPERVDAGSP